MLFPLPGIPFPQCRVRQVHVHPSHLSVTSLGKSPPVFPPGSRSGSLLPVPQPASPSKLRLPLFVRTSSLALVLGDRVIPRCSWALGALRLFPCPARAQWRRGARTWEVVVEELILLPVLQTTNLLCINHLNAIGQIGRGGVAGVHRSGISHVENQPGQMGRPQGCVGFIGLHLLHVS